MKFLLVFFTTLLAWAYQAACPPAPNKVGPPDGLPMTTPRIKLRDGRYLSYKEFGVPKDSANYKIIFVHGFDCALIEDLGIYIVSFDRPGYGESDPDPKQTSKSLALDTEELADQLELGSKFYVVGYSMGGKAIWSYLKYIPHRLAGATLIAPVVNYWWPHLPSNLSQQAFSKLFLQDQWSLRVAHYFPSLTYWWNTQKWFPSLTIIAHSPDILSRQDRELKPIFTAGRAAVEGDEDIIVDVTLQRYIAQQHPWINYHELAGAGHMFPYADGNSDAILKALLLGQT
ncbi:putative alpha/beta hydrolase-1 [Helianthus annuus]|nr:putative alpha/beta hydrolase-1 [Helianthus annuus]